jgi:hypothetical protein
MSNVLVTFSAFKFMLETKTSVLTRLDLGDGTFVFCGTVIMSY